MSETIKKTDTEETVEKTFTQEEVNRIVSDRLARERSAKAAELEEREKAVKARELAVIAAEKLAAAGLPKDLNAVLRYDDEASLDDAITKLSSIKGFRNGQETKDGYKVIPNKLPESSERERPEDSLFREAFRVHKE